MAEAVIGMDIGTCVVQNAVGTDLPDSLRDLRLEYRQIVGVACTAWQLDIAIATGFAGGKITPGVDGQGEDSRLMLEDPGRTVTLVHIAVDDEYPPGAATVQGPGGRHGEVVEQAVTRGEIAMGVVRTASAMRRQAVLECQFQGVARAAYCGKGAGHQRLGPGEALPSDLCFGEPAVEEPVQIGAVMDAFELRAGGRFGFGELVGFGDARTDESLVQHHELAHRKRVTIG